MSVIQPMYFAAGKYSAGTVRKHLSSLFQSAADGTRIEGVVRASDTTLSMKVVPSSGRNLLVKTGLCVIADKATQSLGSQDEDQPGLYIAGVDDTDHAITIAANSGSTRYDLVYAEVTETSFTITNKTLGNTTGSASATNTAKLTTSSAHGFVVGQTVIVSNVDETFDGQYIITSIPSTTTFEYAKTASDVVSVAVSTLGSMQVGSTLRNLTSTKSLSGNTATITTSSAHGLTTAANAGDLITVRGVDTLYDGTYHLLTAASSTITYNINRTPIPSSGATSVTAPSARVPFAVKVLTGTTSKTPSLPSSTNSIKLAVVKVANGDTTISSDEIYDLRTFATSLGGVYIYTSYAADPSIVVSQPTLPEGSLSYDTYTDTFQYYDADAIAGNGETFSLLTLGSSGGTAETASKSDHTHAGSDAYLGISQVNTIPWSGTVFPTFRSTTTLSANKKYYFEGLLIYEATAPNYTGASVYLSFNFSSAVTAVTSFHTIDFGTSFELCGYSTTSTTSGQRAIAALLTSETAILKTNIRGFITLSSSNVTVRPELSVGSGGSDPTSKGLSFVKFLEVGSSTATVTGGTWS